MTTLRVIIVGLGARSRTWMQVLTNAAATQLVGLVDPNPDALEHASTLAPYALCGLDLASMDGVEADVVLLCTPPAGREQQMEWCCTRGFGILAEKPLATDLVTAARYVAMAEAAEVPLIVGLNFRYLEVTQKMRALLHSGAYGKMGFTRFTYERWRDGTQQHLNKYPLTMDQPMLWEQSIHHFDLMRYVYGTDARRISARTFNPEWSMYAGDANVSALIDFKNDMHASYLGTWQGGLDRLDFDWRTDCSEGVVAQRGMFDDLYAGKRADGELAPIALPPHEQWISDATALWAMCHAAFCGTGPIDCSGRDHLQSLMMVQACILSSEREAPVDLSEIEASLPSLKVS
ncbi:Gfo/Idh/MocA family protein [Falsihalocynthiibacter sp. BN13B15]|uniref:Gfo/Idh/MocA family protein n=1 Tax=Falsihalocynthiibacter sp. BN13B15 TaxID=3240871 RepID=UPI00350FA21D